jgi:hypothetical protein
MIVLIWDLFIFRMIVSRRILKLFVHQIIVLLLILQDLLVNNSLGLNVIILIFFISFLVHKINMLFSNGF